MMFSGPTVRRHLWLSLVACKMTLTNGKKVEEGTGWHRPLSNPHPLSALHPVAPAPFIRPHVSLQNGLALAYHQVFFTCWTLVAFDHSHEPVHRFSIWVPQWKPKSAIRRKEKKRIRVREIHLKTRDRSKRWIQSQWVIRMKRRADVRPFH